MVVSMVQVRMARAALGWTVKQLAEQSGVHKNTILRIEAGLASQSATLRIVQRTLEDAGIKFLDAVEGVDGVGVRLKWGVEPTKIGNIENDASTHGEGGSGLNALNWKRSETEFLADIEGISPLSWTDEMRSAQIEHWRSYPEEWAALREISRQALLCAMGVDSLCAE
jgi:transcriptional regulator with XRE-family HTH domain